MAKGSSKAGFMAGKSNSPPKGKIGSNMAPSSPTGARSGAAKGPPSRKGRAKQ